MDRTNAFWNPNERMSNGVDALANRSVADSASLRTESVVRIAVGRSWHGPDRPGQDAEPRDAPDCGHPRGGRQHHDARGKGGQEPRVRVPRPRLDAQEQTRCHEPPARRVRASHERHEDPRQVRVGRHEVVPLELGRDGTAEHRDERREDRS